MNSRPQYRGPRPEEEKAQYGWGRRNPWHRRKGWYDYDWCDTDYYYDWYDTDYYYDWYDTDYYDDYYYMQGKPQGSDAGPRPGPRAQGPGPRPGPRAQGTNRQDPPQRPKNSDSYSYAAYQKGFKDGWIAAMKCCDYTEKDDDYHYYEKEAVPETTEGGDSTIEPDPAPEPVEMPRPQGQLPEPPAA